MYRVVIVDDEDLIVHGLKKVLDWEAYGCRVVGTASDAAEGAKVIREQKPDILFTDIKMPGDDGLTMIAGLKGEFPRMQISILTGYRDFDYARRAIRLGVTRFLLKPSRMDELEEALHAMCAELERHAPVSEEEIEADTAEEETEDSPANSFILRQAQAFVAEHHTEHLSLQDVADHCYVSQWHLSKLLNRYLNQNFYDLLNAERIEHAKELLQDPALRVSDVSEEVGYSDVAHFSRVFKRITGSSPGEWRNRHGEAGL